MDTQTNKKKENDKDRAAHKAFELKQKILELQKNKQYSEVQHSKKQEFVFTDNKSPETVLNQRNWNKTIIIEKRPEISSEELLKNIKYEYECYDVQTQKFSDIINNIENNKENFYPPEAKHLFKDYLKVIDILKQDLKTMENNIKKNNE